MKTNPWFLLFTVSACLASTQVFADVSVAVSAEIRLGKIAPPTPPVIEVIEPVGPKGPPPWAPAHGFRRNRDYYFYPGANVYYRPADRMWFFFEGENWRAGIELPASVRIDFSRSISLSMETDTPYIHHTQVVAYYPSDYFKRVKIKEPNDKNDKAEKAPTASDSEKGGPPGHSGGHPGKGKGKNK